MNTSEKLGQLEKYLMADLANNLHGSCFLFRETDLGLLHKMDALKGQNSTGDVLLKEFSAMGRELMNTTKLNSDSKWLNYRAIISLKTYVFYSQQVIFDIVDSKNGVTQDKFSLAKYRENYKTIKEVQRIIADNILLFDYHQETVKSFSDSYR